MNSLRAQLLTCLVFLLSPAFLAAAEEPAVYAVTNARIVTVSGPPIERGTVVIRNGIIEAVGPDIAVPGDARVIDAAGLTVYPGLIDALSDFGLEEAQAQPASPSRTTPSPGPPSGAAPAAAQQPRQSPDERLGLTPYRQVSELINPANRKIEAGRAAGITTALVAPRRGFFPGQSALVNLSGGDIGQMVLKIPVGFHINLASARGFGGGYPGSPMGVFAFVRQTLLDAEHYGIAWGIYRANPGARRPEYSRALEALQPVVKKEIRAVLPGDDPTQIRRVLDLAEACKLDIMLSGGAEAAGIAPVLKERKIPVLLSVKYPERDRDADPDLREEFSELKRRVEAPANPAALARAGVIFAFQSGDMANPRDFVRNVGKAVEAGLDRDVALRALTLTPAEVFGVADRLGSIEKNKTANLVLATGDIFKPDTRVKFVFIDGMKFEITEADTSTSETQRPQRPGGEGN